MDIVLTVHSIVRWTIVFVAIVALIRFAIGWLGKQEYRPIDQGLMRTFMVLLDLQALLGIILLIGRGVLRYQLEHAFLMILAVVLVHLSARWRNAEDKVKFRNNFLVIVAALILVFVGVSMLPQGWLG